ncbi:hypothetical protein KPL74_06445 [Bacillus sp. NP157]|nr:hypothetical protein KPL74_06445 [Bacillus sp. NP157]
MSYPVAPGRSPVANAVYGILNPIPFGCFVAALVFDIAYAKSATVLFGKAAAWLVCLGLVVAIIPRLISLFQVFVTSRRTSTHADHVDFWLNFVAIVAAILNAFVHSRDAYAIVPAAMWLSALTVLLIAIGHAVIAVRYSSGREYVHG